MAFSRVNISGWAFGEILTSTQANNLDIDHANAIDGADGGTYTLSAPLVINGDNVEIGQILTALQVNVDTLNVTGTGPAAFGGNIDADGDVFCDDVIAADDITAGGNISGRVLETITTKTASASVDVAAFRNIYLGASAAAQTLTLTDSDPSNNGVFFISNASGNSWNIAGILTNSIADGEVLKVIRISGTWTIFFRL